MPDMHDKYSQSLRGVVPDMHDKSGQSLKRAVMPDMHDKSEGDHVQAACRKCIDRYGQSLRVESCAGRLLDIDDKCGQV